MWSSVYVPPNIIDALTNLKYQIHLSMQFQCRPSSRLVEYERRGVSLEFHDIGVRWSEAGLWKDLNPDLQIPAGSL